MEVYPSSGSLQLTTDAMLLDSTEPKTMLEKRPYAN
jgi:hypothetical protein